MNTLKKIIHPSKHVDRDDFAQDEPSAGQGTSNTTGMSHNMAGKHHGDHHHGHAPEMANPITKFGSGNEMTDPRLAAEADRAFPGANPNPNIRAL